MDTTKRLISIGTLIFVLISTILTLDLNFKDNTKYDQTESTENISRISPEDTVNKIASTRHSSVSLSGTLKKFEDKLSGEEILTRSGILSIVNTERISRNLSTMSLNQSLNESATIKAKDILANQYFAHTAPNGTTVDDLVEDTGYQYLKVGENLALGEFVSDSDVMKAWMASPGHKANILDAQFDELGVGIQKGVYEGATVYVVVQHFGRPTSDCPSIDKTILVTYESVKQKVLDTENELKAIKATVDEGRANGQLMNEEAEAFNELNTKYKNYFNELNQIRNTYNLQVQTFNSCLDQE